MVKHNHQVDKTTTFFQRVVTYIRARRGPGHFIKKPLLNSGWLLCLLKISSITTTLMVHGYYGFRYIPYIDVWERWTSC